MSLLLALTGSGGPAFQGDAFQTDAFQAASASISGGLSATLGAATLSSAAALRIAADASVTLGAATLSSAAELLAAGNNGTLAATLGAATLDSSALLIVSGALSATLGAATLSASASLSLSGSVSATLEPCAGSADAEINIIGAGAGQLDAATLVASAKLDISGAAAVTLGAATLVSASVIGNPATTISAQHAAWLEFLARVNGLIAPLEVSPTMRSDGVLVQTIEGAEEVTVTTVSAPSGAAGPSALTSQQAEWLENLVRLHGRISPLMVTATGRSDGVLSQQFEMIGSDTTRITTQ